MTSDESVQIEVDAIEVFGLIVANIASGAFDASLALTPAEASELRDGLGDALDDLATADGGEFHG